MNVIPSIDIQNNRCVRLTQGHFDKSVIYSSSPQDMAKRFKDDGAQILHVVDIDGAKNGKITQTAMIQKIITAFGGDVQVGGGIRKFEDIKALLDMGAKRVVIGTCAISAKTKVLEWINEYGTDKIILALDFKIKDAKPYLAITGWQQKTTACLWDVLTLFKGITQILCTDIMKDGMEQGPNFKFYKECLSRHPNVLVQASGGISCINDLTKLKTIGIHDCIIGKAISERKLTIKDATAYAEMTLTRE